MNEKTPKQAIESARQATLFGDLVAHLRRKAGLSQVEAAEKAGQWVGLDNSGHTRWCETSATSWSAIENGNSNPLGAYLKALGRMQAIASALGMSLDDLIKQL